jgi:hypothetical protein
VDREDHEYKVSRVLREIGWPFVYRAETTSAGQIEEAIAAVTNPQFRPEISRIRAYAVARSNAALNQTCQIIANLVGKDVEPATLRPKGQPVASLA